MVVNTLVTTYPQRIRYRSLKGDYSPLQIRALGPPFASSMWPAHFSRKSSLFHLSETRWLVVNYSTATSFLKRVLFESIANITLTSLCAVARIAFLGRKTFLFPSEKVFSENILAPYGAECHKKDNPPKMTRRNKGGQPSTEDKYKHYNDAVSRYYFRDILGGWKWHGRWDWNMTAPCTM